MVCLVRKQRWGGCGFGPGGARPGENALAAEYGVSRLSIRRSLDALEAESLIERRQGRGTFVAGPALLSVPQQSSDIDALIAHMARMGMQTKVRLDRKSVV